MDGYELEEDLFLAMEQQGQILKPKEGSGKRVKVMIDGPYGGLKIHMEDFAEVLIVAGGSGVTFLLGTIEEVLRVRERGTGPSNITAVWAVGNGVSVESLLPTFTYLQNRAKGSGVVLKFNLFVTRSSAPSTEELPSGTQITLARPKIVHLVHQALDADGIDAKERSGVTPLGPLAVIACGPEALVAETRNAVAGLGISDRVRRGGVEFHGESYAL